MVESRRSLMLAILLVALALPLTPLRADEIVTTNNKTLRGVIINENEEQIVINDRGTITPVPRNRIVSVKRLSVNENARQLKERAEVAIDRELTVARVLIEQAMGLDPTDPVLLEELNALQAEVANREKHKSPRERERIAQDLMRRAKVAFDRIRIDEGYELLIQSLRADPTYEDAHQLINDRINRQPRPDLLLCAKYFSDVMWPDQIRPESNIIRLLPDIYAALVDRFEKLLPTRDLLLIAPEEMTPREVELQRQAVTEREQLLERARTFYEYMVAIQEAFERYPSWKTAGVTAPDRQTLLNRPFQELMTELIRNNLAAAFAEREDAAHYDFILAKLRTWAEPTDSIEILILFVRAHAGRNDYAGAREATAAALNTAGGGDPQLVNMLDNALRLVNEARSAMEAGNDSAAIDALNKVFANQERLSEVPELTQYVGSTLAGLRSGEIEELAEQRPLWRAADTAAMSIIYGEDRQVQRKAAQIFNRLSTRFEWNMDVTVRLDGRELPLSDSLEYATAQNVAQPMAVGLDPQSPFELALTIDIRTQQGAGTQELINQMQSGTATTISQVLSVTDLSFALTARHPALGLMLQTEWSAVAPPRPVLERLWAQGKWNGPSIGRENWPGPISETTSEFFYISTPADVYEFLGSDPRVYVPGRLRPLFSQLSVPRMRELLAASRSNP